MTAYRNAETVLPGHLLEAIQRYVDGEYVYIPRRQGARRAWGEGKQTKRRFDERNAKMVGEYRAGLPVRDIAERHCLSEKAVYKVLAASRAATGEQRACG